MSPHFPHALLQILVHLELCGFFEESLPTEGLSATYTSCSHQYSLFASKYVHTVIQGAVKDGVLSCLLDRKILISTKTISMYSYVSPLILPAQKKLKKSLVNQLRGVKEYMASVVASSSVSLSTQSLLLNSPKMAPSLPVESTEQTQKSIRKSMVYNGNPL